MFLDYSNEQVTESQPFGPNQSAGFLFKYIDIQAAISFTNPPKKADKDHVEVQACSTRMCSTRH